MCTGASSSGGAAVASVYIGAADELVSRFRTMCRSHVSISTNKIRCPEAAGSYGRSRRRLSGPARHATPTGAAPLRGCADAAAAATTFAIVDALHDDDEASDPGPSEPRFGA